MSLNKKNLLLL